MQARTAWIGKHVQHIKFWFAAIVAHFVGATVFPVLLPFGFYCSEVVFHKTKFRQLADRIFNIVIIFLGRALVMLFKIRCVALLYLRKAMSHELRAESFICTQIFCFGSNWLEAKGSPLEALQYK